MLLRKIVCVCVCVCSAVCLCFIKFINFYTNTVNFTNSYKYCQKLPNSAASIAMQHVFWYNNINKDIFRIIFDARSLFFIEI